MKLLFFIPQMVGGGAQRVMANLINGLVDLDYSITLVTDTSVDCAYEIDPRIKVVHHFVDDYPCVTTNVFNKLYRRYWEAIQYRKIALSERPDVAISFITRSNYYCIVALFGTGIPVICSEHTNIMRRFPKKVTLKRNFTYPFANCITVLTHYDYRIVKKKFPWHAVRMPNLLPDYSDSETKNKEKVILSVGCVASWDIKGYDLLIKAWGNIANDFPEWELKIAGRYDERSLSVLSEIIDSNNIPRVNFLGFRKDTFDLMLSAEVYCLSSRIEGLPMALIEAMTAGCCCVAYNCISGPSEIIRNNFSGLLAQAESVEDLSQQLRKVLSDDSLRSRLSSNASVSVRQYRKDLVINRWEILFSKVCKLNKRNL